MTSGFELTTAITNIFIALLALFVFIKLKNKKFIDEKWKLFFLLLFFAGTLGVIIHGILMKDIIKKILWIILSFVFGIIINLLLIIFLNKKHNKYGLKEVFLLTFCIYIILLVEILFNINFVPTYTIYAGFCGGLITYLIIKDSIKNNKYFLVGLAFQYLGAVIILLKKVLPFYILNHNGIYHLCMCFTIIFFYINLKKRDI